MGVEDGQVCSSLPHACLPPIPGSSMHGEDERINYHARRGIYSSVQFREGTHSQRIVLSTYHSLAIAIIVLHSLNNP